MTHPAVTAAVTAAREFADTLEKAQAALNAPSDPPEVKVGYTALTRDDALALLGRLPRGAKVTDRDGDDWTIRGDGQASFREDRDPQANEYAAEYCPLTVVYLPAATAKPAFKRGDKVRITGRSRYGADNIGRTGTVGDTPYRGTGDVEVFVNGIQYVYQPDHIVAESQPAPLVVDFRTTEDCSRSVSAAKSLYQTGAYLRLATSAQSASVHLTKEETRRLAATLTAIADAP